MKKFAKIIVFVLIGLFILIGFGLSYVKIALPNVGEAGQLKVKLTPERIERGEYLANHVTVCIDCHSTRQWDKFTGPIDSSSIGSGGETFDQSMDFPGEFHAPNITSYHLKEWSDGELFRTITTGVSKDGRALFPVMPYLHFGRMAREDVYAIIAYLRILPMKQTTVKASAADFPMNFIINTIPAKASIIENIPAKTDTVKYGGYLVNAASCSECHTNQEKGQPVAGMDFAGGFAFKFPGGITYSSNITPDPATGIGNWTRRQFIDRFKQCELPGYVPKAVGKEEFQTVMPWTMYAGMTAEDLAAIYAYLRTVKPVSNAVEKFVKN